MRQNLLYMGLSFALFCAGYLLINQQILVQSILYRAAANDYHSAIIALVAMGLQAIALLVGLIFLPKRLFWLALTLIGISATINVIFSQILSDIIDLPRFNWLLTEARQAGNAAGEFTLPAAIGLAKVLLALASFAGCRMVFQSVFAQNPGRMSAPIPMIVILTGLLLPSLAFSLGAPGPKAAERNIYGFAIETLTVPPPPARGAVELVPENAQDSIEKIVIIVDESVNHDAFSKLITPDIERFEPIDFGNVAALANCSSPAHVAMRSGVDVMNVNPDTDLRKTPSIWGYAKQAGYRTILIDGQVSGPPQNLLLPPELALIDEIHSAAAGMETDLKIANQLNARLKTADKEYIYTVLRGVHFQYRDHYPAGSVPEDAPLGKQYEAAISYSKKGFFDALLDGVDREKVAIVYTSDHGQKIAENVMPHCSTNPEKEEFSIPLIAFLPEYIAREFPASITSNRSASQIFPSTLAWMGYDPQAAAQKYGNILAKPSDKYVWFGRAVTPLNDGDRIEVHVSTDSLVE
ncbi:sulfatase-like hydrolase/transferase [Parasphingorhabdus sp.]|uniref:sulfatase-like hydrolase/transferase n=1 Tax=Parasphingorhabdus sp. TaxID=2709688 RepID=UPI003D2B31AA